MDTGMVVAVIVIGTVLLVLGAAGVAIGRMPAAVRKARVDVMRADCHTPSRALPTCIADPEGGAARRSRGA
jgi:hypothetical protein